VNSRPDGGAAALRCLIRSGHNARADDLPMLVSEAGRLFGSGRTTIYVIDYDQVLLVPLTSVVTGFGEPVRVEGTLVGRAFSDVTIVDRRTEEALTVWTPLIDGSDRVGVLEYTFDGSTEFGEDLRADCEDVAGLVAELLVTRSTYGDTIERVRRRTPLTLPAELQWRLLPPLTFVTPRVAISGVLAPATEVAGDSFDYAVNGDTAHLAIVDAMGHGLEATLLAAVAISALRNARRSGLPLLDTVRLMDSSIATQFGPDKFVTAIVGELDIRTGVWTWVTCGHPAALLVRRGRVVKTLESVISPPLGLLVDKPELGEERLEPGDRLVFYTDGVIEARDATGEFFGTERLVDFVTREAAASRPAPETLRRLNLAILNHQAGALDDDATVVVLEWLTGQDQVVTV